MTSEPRNPPVSFPSTGITEHTSTSSVFTCFLGIALKSSCLEGSTLHPEISPQLPRDTHLSELKTKNPKVYKVQKYGKYKKAVKIVINILKFAVL